MRIETKQIEIYKYDELDDTAKERVLDYFRSNIDDFYSEYVIDDSKEMGKLLGIDIKNIYYSGFSNQGDGACFTGSYSYSPIGKKRSQLKHDAELIRICDALIALQREANWKLTANVAHRGHYYHAYCTDIDVNTSNVNHEEALKELLRDYMHWIYKSLETDYDYQCSEECIRETIEANEYEFTKERKLA